MGNSRSYRVFDLSGLNGYDFRSPFDEPEPMPKESYVIGDPNTNFKYSRFAVAYMQKFVYGKDGADGQPGIDGQPGGLFFGIGDEFVGGNQLKIIANGGNGGDGQNGGNGTVGADPPNIRTPKSCDNFCMYNEEYQCTSNGCRGLKLTISHSYDDNLTCNYTILYYEGKKGGNGGDGGAKGVGGKAGIIQLIFFDRKPDIYMSASPGIDGRDGQGGYGALGGKSQAEKLYHCKTSSWDSQWDWNWGVFPNFPTFPRFQPFPSSQNNANYMVSETRGINSKLGPSGDPGKDGANRSGKTKEIMRTFEFSASKKNNSVQKIFTRKFE